MCGDLLWSSAAEKRNWDLNPGLTEPASEFAHLPQFLEMTFFLKIEICGPHCCHSEFWGTLLSGLESCGL